MSKIEDDPVFGHLFDTSEKKAKWLIRFKIGYILWIIFMITGFVIFFIWFLLK
jgi:hypothetical protein